MTHAPFVASQPVEPYWSRSICSGVDEVNRVPGIVRFNVIDMWILTRSFARYTLL